MNDLSVRLAETIRTVPDFPKPGIAFKDITPIFLDPALISDCIDALTGPFFGEGVTHVVGIESRGFLLGPMMAQRLDCGFVIVRKKGKLPGSTSEITYDLEYGSATLEMHEGALKAGDRVLVHDDLLATGGTAAATAKLCAKNGATVLGFGFLVHLAYLNGMKNLAEYAENVVNLVDFPG